MAESIPPVTKVWHGGPVWDLMGPLSGPGHDGSVRIEHMGVRPLESREIRAVNCAQSLSLASKPAVQA